MNTILDGTLQSITSLNPGNPDRAVRHILAAYGVRSTYEAFQRIIQSDYEFLSTLFAQKIQEQNTEIPQKKKEVKKATPVTPSTPETTPSATQNKSEEQATNPFSVLKANTVIKVKKEGSSQPVNQPEEVHAPTTSEQLEEEEEPEQAKPPFSTSSPPKGMKVPEIKKWQKEQEEKKSAELKEKGINPESLLTKENLKQWIEKEGRAYSHIARDIVGLPEMYIGEVAKKFGLKSALAMKRRAAIVAARGGR
jgi:hypothetical protein